jgi:hypothetical protein
MSLSFGFLTIMPNLFGMPTLAVTLQIPSSCESTHLPKPSGKQKNAASELTWYGAGKVVHLTLPPTK